MPLMALAKNLELYLWRGVIRGGSYKGKSEDLPAPSWKPEVTTQTVPPYAEFMVALEQPMSPATAAEFLKAFEDSFVSLDFRSLNIVVELVDNPTNRSRMPLWDGVMLRRRDDIYTGRLTMMSASAAIEFSSSATLSGGKND